MKILNLAITLFTVSNFAFAGLTCEQIRDGELESKRIKSVNILNNDNWKNFDVVAAMSKEQCLENGFSQTLIEIGGEKFYRIVSNEDFCDGGNSYGSIYREDLKTPVAHIYDGDFTCESDGWSKEYRAENHKCDELAEQEAAKKMKEFGFDFKVTDSHLEMRKHYIYSFIHVNGKIENKGNKEAQVRVLVRLDSCTLSSSKITSLYL